MRYVMVWFTCSYTGCEAKAEHMVPARWYKDQVVVLAYRSLPDGWSNYGEYTNAVYQDDQNTFCPAHRSTAPGHQ